MHILRLRADTPGVDTLCPWQHLTHDGVVTDGRGLMIAGYYASPPDAASSTPAEREATARALNAALLNFGTGTAFWTDVAVVPAAEYPDPSLSFFPDPISRAVDEERRRQFMAAGAHFENERAFIVCYQPPGATEARVAEMMYQQGSLRDTPQAVGEQAFNRMLTRFEDTAGRALRLRRMQSYLRPGWDGRPRRRDELVNYLHYCLTGQAQEIDIPNARLPLSAIIGGVGFGPGETPLVGDQYVANVVIEGFPAESAPGILDALSQLEMPYRFTQRFIPFDQVEAQRILEAKRKFWRQRTRSFFAAVLGMGGLVNQDALDMVSDCDAALKLNTAGNVKFGWYNATVVVRHEDQRTLIEMAREAERAIRRCQFACRIETVNAPDAFLATLPGNTTNNIKRPMIHTYNVADLAPSSGIWTGSPVHPNNLYPEPAPALIHGRTAGGAPFRWNNAVGQNGNFAFFGPPGSGKTTLFNGVSLQFLRYQRAAIRSVDYKWGMKAACLATGGAYYELGTSEEPQFCPFERLETAPDRFKAQEWAETVYVLQHGTAPGPDQRQAIHEMLGRLATSPSRSITHALMLCSDQKVKQALRYYSLDGGAGGRIFDGESNDFADTHWDAYDITEIMGSGDKILLPALMCLEDRFDRIEDGRPILETYDEAWVVVDHPIWRPRFRGRLKTKRSKVVSIGLATQNLEDMVRRHTDSSSMLSIMLENVPSILYGANPKATQGGEGDEKGPADFYKEFGLNEQQRLIIEGLTPAREYYATSPDGCREVDFGFGPFTLAFAGATSEAAVRRVTELHRQHGDAWVEVWLREKKVDYASLLAQ